MLQGGKQYMAGEMSAEEATKTTEAPAVMTVAGEEGKISFGKPSNPFISYHLTIIITMVPPVAHSLHF